MKKLFKSMLYSAIVILSAMLIMTVLYLLFAVFRAWAILIIGWLFVTILFLID